MDRQFAFAGAIPQNTDVLSTNKNMLYGLGHLIQAALGTGTSVVGLVGAQSAVPDLHITIGPGAIYSSQTVDASAYGDLGTDANTVMKQGILKAAQTLTLTAPGTSGYSQVYLVEAAYQDVDGGATVLPYYNSSNPSAPYSGPANAGTSNYTVRQGSCVITLKAGTAATTGSQTTPSTDAGYVALYTITLANGQTAITTAQIVPVTGAPFVPYNLNNLPFLKSQTDTGTANALVVTEPAISALFVGLTLTVKKSSSANTGAATLNVNGLGATSLVWADGTALIANDWPANVTGLVEYDGTQWNLLSVMGPSVFGRLGASGKAPGGLIARRIFTTTQTYTPSAGTNKVRVTVVGGGAGGGGSDAMSASQFAGGGGGGGGEVATNEYTSGFSGVTMTIGAGGAGATGALGGNGGATSFGALLTANGGAGGAKGQAFTIATIQAGGAGGTGGSGAATYRSPGAAGASGVAFQTTNGCSGFGGASYIGAGASAVYSATLAGIAATTYGAGGSGAYGSNSGAAQKGGDGAGGCTIVEEYA